MHGFRTAIVVLAVLALVAPSGLTDWPQYRHDDEHSGKADLPGAIRSELEPWAFQADGTIVSSPAVTDVEGDRLIFFGSYTGSSNPGTVYALTPDGQARWSTTPLDSSGGYIASPTVEDLDGDGAKDVVLPSLDDSTIRVFDAATGEQTWSSQVGSSGEDLLASSPIVADLTGAPGKEIVLGGSTSEHNGSLLLYDDDGTQLQAIELDGPAWSTPLYEDLDQDGEAEIAVATGVPEDLQTLFPSAKTGGQSLYVFERGADGWSTAHQFGMAGPSLASPVAGDLDHDGDTELVVGDQEGHIHVVNPSTGQREVNASAADFMAALSSPVVADIDEDGRLELALGAKDGIRAFEMDANGPLLADGHLQLPYYGDDGNIEPWVGAGLAVEDVDGDGVRDLLGMTVPVNVDTNNLLDSDVLPGHVFAVNGSDLSSPDGIVFNRSLPDDGGMSGPTFADVDGDGRSEVLAGEGVPVLGNGTRMHYIDAANPVVEAIATDPAEPRTIDDIQFTPDDSDEDHAVDELTYTWDLGDGTTATGREPVHSYDDDGTYNLTVRAQDPDGHNWTHHSSLAVANVPPDLDTQIDTTPGSLEVTVDGQASDPDGTVNQTRWHMGDGTTLEGPTHTHNYSEGGTYDATFEAVDDDGDTSSLQRAIDVNRFPNLTGPDQVNATEGQMLTVSLPYDDPDGDPVHVASIAGADGAEATVLENETELAWTPGHDIATRSNSPVPVDVEVTIEDEGSPAGTANHMFTAEVENTNRAPNVTGPDRLEVATGETDSAEGTASDPDGNPITVNATGLPDNTTFERDGDTWQITASPSADAETTTYNVTVEADDDLDVGTHDLQLEVVPNRPPEVAIQGPSSVEAHTRWSPNEVTFEPDIQDPDGDPIDRVEWAVGDTTSPLWTFEHAFEEHGRYEVELTAWDVHGANATASHAVEVDDQLTGELTVQPSRGGPIEARHVTLKVAYDDGTPLGGTEVSLEVSHQNLAGSTESRDVVTGPDGEAKVRIEGDEGLPVFIPGKHTITVEAAGPSLSDAPVSGTEKVSMHRDFHVSASPSWIPSWVPR